MQTQAPTLSEIAPVVSPVTGNHEPMVTNAPREFDDASFGVGDATAQGDWLLIRIEELPKSARAAACGPLQIPDFDQDSTPHVFSDGEMYTADAAECVAAVKKSLRPAVRARLEPYFGSLARYVGPVIVGGRLTHMGPPERKHGTQIFPAHAVIVTIKARDFDLEGREEAVRD